MRACDWAATPLGSPDTWPSSLSAVVQVMLTSRFAMWMAWGPELTFLCNDAYLPTVGIKRDWVIGSRSDKVWAEIWPDIGPRIRHVLTTGEATWDEALLLYLERSGFTEETYHTFSYSPLADDDGATNGMLCVVAEVTEQRDRRAPARDAARPRRPARRLVDARGGHEGARSLSGRRAPRPAVRAGLSRRPGPRRCSSWRPSHGLAANRRAASRHASRLDDPDPPWPLTRATRNEPTLVDVPSRAGRRSSARPLAGSAAGERWPSPIRSAEGEAPVGYLVAGLNPHRAARRRLPGLRRTFDRAGSGGDRPRRRI